MPRPCRGWSAGSFATAGDAQPFGQKQPRGRGRALVRKAGADAAPDPDCQEARADRKRWPAGEGSGGRQTRARPDVRQSRRSALSDFRAASCAGDMAGAAGCVSVPAMNVHPGSASRAKGPLVFLDMDQQALDEAYDQEIWAPNRALIVERRKAASDRARAILGPTEARRLRAERARGPRHLRLRHQRRAGQRVRSRRRVAAERRGRLCAAGRGAGRRRRALRHHRLHQRRSGERRSVSDV